MANFAHKNLKNSGYAFGQTNGGQTKINSNTDHIQALKTLKYFEGIDSSKTFDVSNINASSLSIPDGSLTKSSIPNLNTPLNSLSGYIGTLNTNVPNLLANIANLNTSVSDLGNIETITRAWAEYSFASRPK